MASQEAADGIQLSLRRMLQGGREMQSSLARQLGVRVIDVQAVDHVVSAEEPLGPVDLGNRLGIRSASATTLVDRLVAAGHLVREPHPADARRVALRATEHARYEVRQSLTPMLDEITAAIERLDHDQAATVSAFLHEVTAAMRDYAHRPDRTTPEFD